MPLRIHIGFKFLVPAHPGSPGQGAVKWVCVNKLVLITVHPGPRPIVGAGPYNGPGSWMHCTFSKLLFVPPHSHIILYNTNR